MKHELIFGMPIGDGDAVVAVGRNLYVKTPDALKRLLRRLKRNGYVIKNLRTDKNRREVMEKEGQSLYWARLRDDVLIRKGKCSHCNSYVEVRAIRAHGRDCEVCGKPLCREYTDGGEISFTFANEHSLRGGITMRIKRYDMVKRRIILYANPVRLRYGKGEPGPRARRLLMSHRKEFTRFTEGGHEFIAIPLERGRVGTINTIDLRGQQYYARVVNLYKGQEYGEFGFELPVPESISIYEAWHWAPLKKSPTLHAKILHAAGQTDDKGWHYQDGTPWFRPAHWQTMSTFIRHFTELDADAFGKASLHFRLDGPGGIDDLAAFCAGKAAVVRDEPNVGHLLMGFSKVASGMRLTPGEKSAFERSFADRSTLDTFVEVLKG